MSREAENKAIVGRWFTEFWGNPWNPKVVDELAAPDQVVFRALDWCRFHLALPQRAMRLNRETARADLRALYQVEDAALVDEFVDGWFHPETQAVLHALVAKLKARG